MKNTVKVVMNLLPMSRTRSTPIRMYGLRGITIVTIFFTIFFNLRLQGISLEIQIFINTIIIEKWFYGYQNMKEIIKWKIIRDGIYHI